MAKTRKPPLKKESGDGVFSSYSPLTQDALCIALLYVVTLVLFRGIVFDNASFQAGGDTAAALSYRVAGDHIKETEGVDPLWMPYFFSGMPTFGNVAYVPHDVSYLQRATVTILDLLYLNGKWTWIIVHYFLGGVFMFFLMRSWKFSRPAALFAAFAFMLSPYSIGLAGEGHGSKLMALNYLPMVFLLTDLLIKRRDVLSFGLLAAAIGTLLLSNHMQIVYYAFIAIGLYLLYQIVLDFKANALAGASKAALFLGALLIGLCISSYVYLSVHEYSQYSIRGGGTTGAPGGLTYEYATNWSWHPLELFTLIIPGAFGFQLPYYWGLIDPWTNSTVYVGLLPIILSIIAVAYRRNATTWFFIGFSVLVFLISLGKNFPLVYDLLFNTLPFFNKFRAPAMILHLLPFTFAILGAHGFSCLMETRESETAKLKKALLYGMGTLGALLVIGVLAKASLLPSLASYAKDGELQQYQQQYGAQAPQVIAQLKQARMDILWKDFVKFVLIALASGGTIWLFLSKKISGGMFSTAILGILLVDLFIMDVKFVNPKPASALEQTFQPDATISFLKGDPSLFRVFPLGEAFQDNTLAYHTIQSIGGYSPAKLKIYQTMIDSCLYRGANPNFPINMNIVNMLNVKYVIGPYQLPPELFELVNADQAKRTFVYRNPSMLPRAFFVKDVVVAANQHEVFETLNSPSFNAARTAVVERALPQPVEGADSSSAAMREFASRKIVIDAYTSASALLVLGEVYYPAGWKATLDGTETEIYKTNYILRSVLVPAGRHEIVFTFDPPMYALGYALTNVAWGVAFLCIAIGLFPIVRARLAKKHPEQVHG